MQSSDAIAVYLRKPLPPQTQLISVNKMQISVGTMGDISSLFES